MIKSISAIPVPLPSNLIRRHAPYPFPVGRSESTLWYCGRFAIWQGVRLLGLREGDRVLVPAYACGSEIDALLAAKLSLDFYRVLPGLQVDLGHIEELCRKPARALFITHYFGFAQDLTQILSLAKSSGLIVIEDSAHGLYSTDSEGRPLGSVGDMGIFSFTKTLAVPDGGALVLNGDRVTEATRDRRPDTFAVAGKVRFLIEEAVAQTSPAASRFLREKLLTPIVRRIQARKGWAPAPTPGAGDDARLIAFDRGRADWSMSPAAKVMFRVNAYPAIPEIRRLNFEKLLEGIEPGERVRPLFTSLPEGCSPMVFPIEVDDPDALVRHLWDGGIWAKHFWSYMHPAVPIDRFPLEGGLKRRVVALPVHQDLCRVDMARIAREVNVWQRENAATGRRGTGDPSNKEAV